MVTQPLAEIPINAYVSWCSAREYGTVMALGGRHMSAARIDFVSLDTTCLPYMKFSVPLSIKLGDATLGCMSWSSPFKSRNLGILGTGYHDGTIDLWDPSQLLSSEMMESDFKQRHFDEVSVPGRLATFQPEVGDAITCMEFNTLRPSLIACGHSSGGLQIVNVESLSQPEIYEPGAEPVKAHGKTAVTCVAWNQSVQHILASTSANGSAAIWNLKQRKASIVFRDPAGRSRLSAVAWLPDQATQVIVAYDDDTHPSLQMWDLRNTSYPFKEFQGHSCGIMDIQFSFHDPSLMVTCGKDNRIITWSLNETTPSNSPAIFSEITTSQWQMSTKWSPCLPGLIASSSHIGGVLVDSIEKCQNSSTKHTPTWHCRGGGGSFGFGGKFVHFGETSGCQVQVDTVLSADMEMLADADKFEISLNHNDDIGYCEMKINEAENPYDRLVWRAVEALFYPSESRSFAVLQCLNYDINNILSRVDNFFKTKPRRLMQILERGNVDEVQQNESLLNNNKGSHFSQDQIDTDAKTVNQVHDPLSIMCQKPLVDAETFFNDLGHTDVKLTDKSSPSSGGSQEKIESSEKTPTEIDELREKVSGALATGTRLEKEPKSPISQNSALSDSKKKLDASSPSFSEWENGQELLIKQCFVIGQRPLAIELCVEAGRWAEAFLLAATSEDPFLWSATTQLYFSTKENDKFSQIIGCILRSKWQTLIQISDLKKWNETLALIASYAPPGMLYSMSQELGHRLEREAFDIRAAVVCYLLAGSFDDACRVWSDFTHKSRCRKSFEKDLQGLVEKLTILKRATGHQEFNAFYNKKATQYAEILANSGRAIAGMKILHLIGYEPEDDPCFSNQLRNRIYFSCPDLFREAGIPPPSIRPFDPLKIESGQIQMSPDPLDLQRQMGQNNSQQMPLQMQQQQMVAQMRQHPMVSSGQQQMPQQIPTHMQQQMHTPMQKNGIQGGSLHSRQGLNLKMQQSTENDMNLRGSLQAQQQMPSLMQNHVNSRVQQQMVGRQGNQTTIHGQQQMMPQLQQQLPPQMQQQILAQMQQTLPRQMQQQIPPQIQQRGLAQMQRQVPPQIQQQISPHMQQQLPPHMQQQIPPPIQQQIPPPMQQQIPPPMQQQIPPQMQQQLPPQMRNQIPQQMQQQIPPQLQQKIMSSAPQMHAPMQQHRSMQAQTEGMGGPPVNSYLNKSMQEGVPLSHNLPTSTSIPGGYGVNTQPTAKPVAKWMQQELNLYKNKTPINAAGPSESYGTAPIEKQINKIGDTYQDGLTPSNTEDGFNNLSNRPYANRSNQPQPFNLGTNLSNNSNTNGFMEKQLFDASASSLKQSAPNGNQEFYQKPNALKSSLDRSTTPSTIPMRPAYQGMHNITRSTAPAAGVSSLPQGMPIPWPIPTGTQQVASATQSTAPANQRIHATVNPPISYHPMSQADVALVQQVILDTLTLLKQCTPDNPSKFDDLNEKLQQLISQLQSGTIAKPHQELVLNLCHALREQDFSKASHLQGQLTRLAWTKETRTWLMALRRLTSH